MSGSDPRLRRGLIALSALFAILLPLLLGNGYAMQVMDIALINALVVIGLNVITGWTGQVNFGQAAFYGIGAYVTAVAAIAGVPWILTPVLAISAATLASLALGLPTLRLKTVYLAMATIGFGEIGHLVFVHWESVTGGTSGLREVPGIKLGPFTPDGPLQHFYVLVVILAGGMVFASRLRASRFGRDMIATRDNEAAAELCGVDTVRIKIVAFMIAAGYAGLAGCLYASSIRYVSPDTFTNAQAVLFFTMLVIGGTGSLPGAVAGALLLTILPELFRGIGEYYLIAYGIGVVAVIVLTPSGLAGAFTSSVMRLQPAAR